MRALSKVVFAILPNKLLEKLSPSSLKDKYIEKKYIEAGIIFGDNVSYIYMGECVNFESHLNNWAKREKQYADRGYRTISVDDFINAGGYGAPIDHLVGKKRDEDEVPILHAEIYRTKYLGNIPPAVNPKKLMQGGIQSGTYILPSTEINNLSK